MNKQKSAGAPAKKIRVYISGAITGKHDYMWQFAEAEKHLKSEGYAVANPAALNSVMPEDSSHKDYMVICLDLLDLCDAIYMLPGWEESRGANQEYGYALAKDKIILLG